MSHRGHRWRFLVECRFPLTLFFRPCRTRDYLGGEFLPFAFGVLGSGVSHDDRVVIEPCVTKVGEREVIHLAVSRADVFDCRSLSFLHLAAAYYIDGVVA